MSEEEQMDFLYKNIKMQEDILGAGVSLSQFIKDHELSTIKEISNLVSNPTITETQKVFNKYDEMLKPLHIGALSGIGEALEIRTNGMKNYDFAEYKSLIGNINVADVDAYSISKAIRTVYGIVDPLKASINFSKMDEISASVSGLSSILQDIGSSSLISKITKSQTTITNLSQESLQNINMELLGEVADRVLRESEEWDLETVSEAIASEYDKEKSTDIFAKKEKHNSQIIEKHTIDAKEVREWLNTIINIIMLIVTLTSNSPATTVNNYNCTQQVNNYYIVGMGYNAQELNAISYRIVNRDSVVRLKHDCHSLVIGKLEEGQIVRIIDKCKKWRQIVWEDEDGEAYLGWIQNYKLTEFKMPRRNKNIRD